MQHHQEDVWLALNPFCPQTYLQYTEEREGKRVLQRTEGGHTKCWTDLDFYSAMNINISIFENTLPF